MAAHAAQRTRGIASRFRAPAPWLEYSGAAGKLRSPMDARATMLQGPTAIVTVLETPAPMEIETGTALPAGALAGANAFT